VNVIARTIAMIYPIRIGIFTSFHAYGKDFRPGWIYWPLLQAPNKGLTMLFFFNKVGGLYLDRLEQKKRSSPKVVESASFIQETSLIDIKTDLIII